MQFYEQEGKYVQQVEALESMLAIAAGVVVSAHCVVAVQRGNHRMEDRPEC